MSVYTILKDRKTGKDKVLDLSAPVRVFRNLTTKKDTIKYSIWQKGRLVAHATSVHLRDVSFKVLESGRQNTLTLGRKFVHAFVVGYLEPQMVNTGDFQAASYTPPKGFFFTRQEPTVPLGQVERAVLDVAGLRIINPQPAPIAPPKKKVCGESGEVTYEYRGFTITKNDPDPRLPSYYISEQGLREPLSRWQDGVSIIDNHLNRL